MTGNISTRELIDLFKIRLGDMEAASERGAFVEVHRGLLVVHGSGDAG